MTRKVTLFDRAKADLQSARLILSQDTQDDLFIDIAAYHVQQGIEKLVKFSLSTYGVKYSQTHDMSILYEQLENETTNPPSWIYDNIDVLNSYATNTRYGTNVVATIKKIEQLLEYAEKYQESLQPQTFTDSTIKPENICGYE